MTEDSYLREERNRAREIDSLSEAAKKAINPFLNKVVNGFLAAIKEKENQVKNVKKEEYSTLFPEETADAVAATAEGYVHAVEQLIASSYMLGMIHADEDKPRNGKSITAADEAPEEIPAITFEKAKEFLESKIPMTKSEWLKLEPKLRFRAFTVAKLGQAELIDRVKKELVKSIQSGTGVAQTWDEFKKLAEKSIDNFSPWYWETVFRTNTQSSYVAGKLQRYEGTGAKAYQLMVIDDSRTTDICKNLLRKSGYGMVLPVDHEFWKKYGFPPYHFNCRTSVRAVYSSQIGYKKEILDNVGISKFKNFRVQKGFGGNPVDKESWWKMTESMKAQAEAFGLWGNILQQAYDMDMLNYQKELLQGYDLKYKGKKGGYVEASKNWVYSEKEMTAAKIMADKGHTVYLLPRGEMQNIKNPDILIDNQIGEIKQLNNGTQTAVDNEIKKAAHQRARIVFLQIPDTDVPLKTLIETAKNRQKRSGKIEKILVYFQGVLSEI